SWRGPEDDFEAARGEPPPAVVAAAHDVDGIAHDERVLAEGQLFTLLAAVDEGLHERGDADAAVIQPLEPRVAPEMARYPRRVRGPRGELLRDLVAAVHGEARARDGAVLGEELVDGVPEAVVRAVRELGHESLEGVPRGGVDAAFT